MNRKRKLMGAGAAAIGAACMMAAFQEQRPRCVGATVTELRVSPDEQRPQVLIMRAFEDGTLDFRTVPQDRLRRLGTNWTRLVD